MYIFSILYLLKCLSHSQQNFNSNQYFVSLYSLSSYHVLSLFFQVRELVSECQCPTQFPMIRVSEGKYRIGDTQVLIFVRVRLLLKTQCQSYNTIEFFKRSFFFSNCCNIFFCFVMLLIARTEAIRNCLNISFIL